MKKIWLFLAVVMVLTGCADYAFSPIGATSSSGSPGFGSSRYSY